MSGFMPYLAESGRSARLFEMALNGAGYPGTRSWKERAIDTIADVGSTGKALRRLLPETAETRAFIEHLNVDFFGAHRVDGHVQTGFWEGWSIPKADRVVQLAAWNALALALGRDAHGQPTRNDRISVLWVCNVDGFQAVVRRVPSGRDGGLVTITMLTPAVQGHAVTDDLGAGPFGGSTRYACPPTDYTVENALWLVGQQKLEEPEEERYVQSGPVLTVSPAYEDGGA